MGTAQEQWHTLVIAIRVRYIPAGEGGLAQNSVALCHQIQVRGKALLLTKLGELPADRFDEVQERLLDVLGM